MGRLAKMWIEGGRRPHPTWKFDKGADTPVHTELRSLGMIKWLGTSGASYVLTDSGFDHLRSVVDQLDSEGDE